MPEEINISVNAKIRNGPDISFSVPLKIEAYDKLDFEVVKGETKTIQLLPTGATSVQFLLIKSSQYDKKISYKVNGAGTKIILDTPQCFIGVGSMAALVATNVPETIEFKNALTQDDAIRIQILVGRDPPT